MGQRQTNVRNARPFGTRTSVSKPTFVAVVLVAALTALAATATGEAKVASSAVLVKVAYNKKLNKSILVASNGRTLYMFTEDTKGVKEVTLCTAQGPWGSECPSLWPPLVAHTAPRAGTGVKASLLGVVKRSDGKQQVTYNGHPLYYWHGGAGYPGDKSPGDVKGEGFVGEWFVLSPKGTPITK